MIEIETNTSNSSESTQTVNDTPAPLTRYELICEIKKILKNIKTISQNPSDLTEQTIKNIFVRLFEYLNRINFSKLGKMGISKTSNLFSFLIKNRPKTAQNIISVVTKTFFDINDKKFNNAAAQIFSTLISREKTFATQILTENSKNSIKQWFANNIVSSKTCFSSNHTSSLKQFILLFDPKEFENDVQPILTRMLKRQPEISAELVSEILRSLKFGLNGDRFAADVAEIGGKEIMSENKNRIINGEKLFKSLCFHPKCSAVVLKSLLDQIKHNKPTQKNPTKLINIFCELLVEENIKIEQNEDKTHFSDFNLSLLAIGVENQHDEEIVKTVLLALSKLFASVLDHKPFQTKIEPSTPGPIDLFPEKSIEFALETVLNSLEMPEKDKNDNLELSVTLLIEKFGQNHRVRFLANDKLDRFVDFCLSQKAQSCVEKLLYVSTLVLKWANNPDSAGERSDFKKGFWRAITTLFKNDPKWDIFRHVPFIDEFCSLYHDTISPDENYIFSNLSKNIFLCEPPNEALRRKAHVKNANLLPREVKLAILSEIYEKYRQNLANSEKPNETRSKWVASFAKSFVAESLLGSTCENLWKAAFVLGKPFDENLRCDSPLLSRTPNPFDFKLSVIDKLLNAKCDETFSDRCGDTILNLSPLNKGAITDDFVNILISEIEKTIENGGNISEDEYEIYLTAANTVSKANLRKLESKTYTFDKNALSKKYPDLNIEKDYEFIKEQEKAEQLKQLKAASSVIIEEEKAVRETVSNTVSRYTKLTNLLLKICDKSSPALFSAGIGHFLSVLGRGFRLKLFYAATFSAHYRLLKRVKETEGAALAIVKSYYKLKIAKKDVTHDLLSKVVDSALKADVFAAGKNNLPVFGFIAPAVQKSLKTKRNEQNSIDLVVLVLKNLLNSSDFPPSDEKICQILAKSVLIALNSVKSDSIESLFPLILPRLSPKSDDVLIGKYGLMSRSQFCKKEILKHYIKSKPAKFSAEMGIGRHFFVLVHVLKFDRCEEVSDLARDLWDTARNVFSKKEGEANEFLIGGLIEFFGKIGKSAHLGELIAVGMLELVETSPELADCAFESFLNKLRDLSPKNKISAENTKISLLNAISFCAHIFGPKCSEKTLFAFFPFLLNDLFDQATSPELWDSAQTTGIKLISHFSENEDPFEKVLKLLETKLKEAKDYPVPNEKSKGLVILMAVLSDSIKEGRANKIKEIFGFLLEALGSLSEAGRKSCSEQVVRISKDAVIGEEFIEKCVKTLLTKLNDINAQIQSGAALGLVSVVSGTGKNTFHRFRLNDEITARLGLKAQSNEKTGAILLAARLFEDGNLVFKPVVLSFLSLIFDCFDNNDTGDAINFFIETSLVRLNNKTDLVFFFEKLKPYLRHLKWRVRLKAFSVLQSLISLKWGSFPVKAVKQSVEEILFGISDTNLNIKSIAKETLKTACLAVKVPELALSNILLFRALAKNEKEAIFKAMKVLTETTFYYKFNGDFICVAAPILLKAIQTPDIEIKTMAVKFICCLFHFTRRPSDLHLFQTELIKALKEAVLDIMPFVRSSAAFSLAKFSLGCGAECAKEQISWALDLVEGKGVNKIKIWGGAESVANLLGLIEPTESKKIFAGHFHNFPSLPEGAREMLLRSIQFFPRTKSLPFITVDTLSLCLSVLSEKGPVYEAAIDAGLALVPALFFTGNPENAENHPRTDRTAETSDPVPDTASALLTAVYTPSESAREGVVQLIARLLFALADTDPAKLAAADSAHTAEVEKALFDSDRLSRATKLKLLAALYYSRHDSFAVAKLANDAWTGLVSRKRRVFELILPFFSKAICFNLSLKENQPVARKVLAAVASDRMAPLFMATLERQTKSCDAVVRRGMVCGVNEILLCATKTRSVDEGAGKIAAAALFDEDESVRAAGAAVFRALFERNGRGAFRELLGTVFNSGGGEGESDVLGGKGDVLGGKGDVLGGKGDVLGEKNDVFGGKNDVLGGKSNFKMKKLALAFESLTKVFLKESECDECREISARFVLKECVPQWVNRDEDYFRMDIIKNAVKMDSKALIENFKPVFEFFVAVFGDFSNEKFADAVEVMGVYDSEKLTKTVEEGGDVGDKKAFFVLNVVLFNWDRWGGTRAFWSIEKSKKFAHRVLFSKNEAVKSTAAKIVNRIWNKSKPDFMILVRALAEFLNSVNIDPKNELLRDSGHLIDMAINALSLKERALQEIGVDFTHQLTRHINCESLSISAISLTGSLIRILNSDFPTDAKIKAVKIIARLLKKCPDQLRPLFPQIQISLIKLVASFAGTASGASLFKAAKTAFLTLFGQIGGKSPENCQKVGSLLLKELSVVIGTGKSFAFESLLALFEAVFEFARLNWAADCALIEDVVGLGLRASSARKGVDLGSFLADLKTMARFCHRLLGAMSIKKGCEKIFQLFLYGNGSVVFKTEFWAVFYSDDAPFGGISFCRKVGKSLCSLEPTNYVFCEQSFLTAAFKVAKAAVRLRKEPKTDVETALLQKAHGIESNEAKNATNPDFLDEIRSLMLSFGEVGVQSCLCEEEKALLVLLALKFGDSFGEHAKNEIIGAVLGGDLINGKWSDYLPPDFDRGEILAKVTGMKKRP